MTQCLEEYEVIWVAPARIYYDGSFNCRGEFTMQSVEALSQSITQVGRLLEPIWLQPAVDVPEIPEGYDWRLIAGHRRYRATTVFLKWITIPARVFRGMTEREARLLNFTENLERKDLNPLEEALTISHLFPTGTSARRIGEELKRDWSWVHKRLRVLQVPEPVQQLIASRRIALLDLEVVCRKETPEEQIAAAEAMAASKRGRAKNAVFIGEKLTRSFRRRRNKSEINGLIAQLFELGVKNNLAIRTAAWCAGSISDDDLDGDIAKEMKTKPPVELY